MPNNHAGFLGGEYGQHGDPEAFAAALRTALRLKNDSMQGL